jgi:hypothetical protein
LSMCTFASGLPAAFSIRFKDRKLVHAHVVLGEVLVSEGTAGSCKQSRAAAAAAAALYLALPFIQQRIRLPVILTCFGPVRRAQASSMGWLQQSHPKTTCHTAAVKWTSATLWHGLKGSEGKGPQVVNTNLSNESTWHTWLQNGQICIYIYIYLFIYIERESQLSRVQLFRAGVFNTTDHWNICDSSDFQIHCKWMQMVTRFLVLEGTAWKTTHGNGLLGCNWLTEAEVVLPNSLQFKGCVSIIFALRSKTLHISPTLIAKALLSTSKPLHIVLQRSAWAWLLFTTLMSRPFILSSNLFLWTIHASVLCKAKLYDSVWFPYSTHLCRTRHFALGTNSWDLSVYSNYTFNIFLRK